MSGVYTSSSYRPVEVDVDPEADEILPSHHVRTGRLPLQPLTAVATCRKCQQLPVNTHSNQPAAALPSATEDPKSPPPAPCNAAAIVACRSLASITSTPTKTASSAPGPNGISSAGQVVLTGGNSPVSKYLRTYWTVQLLYVLIEQWPEESWVRATAPVKPFAMLIAWVTGVTGSAVLPIKRSGWLVLAIQGPSKRWWGRME